MWDIHICTPYVGALCTPYVLYIAHNPHIAIPNVLHAIEPFTSDIEYLSVATLFVSRVKGSELCAVTTIQYVMLPRCHAVMLLRCQVSKLARKSRSFVVP